MILSDVASIRTGLVAARKQARETDGSAAWAYRLLSLRCVGASGVLDVGLAEPYLSKEVLKPDFLTRRDDILLRLSAPYTATLVDSGSEDYVVPSHFAIIRVDKSKADPGYVLWALRQPSTLKRIYQNVSGLVAFGTIGSNFLGGLPIGDCPLGKQRTVGALLQLSEKEQALLSELTKAKAELGRLALRKACAI